MDPGSQAFFRAMKNPVKFRLYLLSRLPNAFFAGIRIKEIDGRRCITTVPYKWFTKNPFRSTYFACLSMAAEMSTGALAMAHLYKKEPAVSMLVVKVESEYNKKATGRTTFICEDGEGLRLAIEEATVKDESTQFRARSVGKNQDGEEVAVFYVTWSFKKRSKKQEASNK